MRVGWPAAARVRVLPLVAFLAAWQVAAMIVGSRALPSAIGVLGDLVRLTLSGQLPVDLAVTLARVAVTFVVAMLAGVLLGIGMGLSAPLDRLLDAPLRVLLNLPALVLIVLVYVWFGLTDAAAVLAVALDKLPGTVVTLRQGTRVLDPALAEMARSLGYGRLLTLRHVILPQLSPYLLAAARTGLAMIWKVMLVAELLGRSSGVGFRIQELFQLFDISGLLAYTLAFVLVMQVIEWLAFRPWERHADRWRRGAPA